MKKTIARMRTWLRSTDPMPFRDNKHVELLCQIADSRVRRWSKAVPAGLILNSIRDQNLVDRGLPEVTYVDNLEKVYGDSPVIAIKRGEPGYYPIHTNLPAADLNAQSGVTPEQVDAMLAGSMFGWHVKAAFPQASKVRSN